MKRLFLVFVAATLCSTPAWADVTIKMSSGAPDAKVKETGATYATPDKLAMIWQPGADMKNGSHVIFDAGKQAMWIIDDSEKSYMVLDKATIDQLGQQMEAGMAQMKEAMAKMPPEQRAMMEKQMGKLMGGGEGKPVERKTTKSGESRTVSGFSCTRYDVTRDGTLASHLWVTPYGQAKITKEDMTAFFKMADFFKSMTGQFSKMFKGQDNFFDTTNQIDGVPILSQIVDTDGKVTREIQIDAINHNAPPAGVFDLPAGYKQKEMPKMGRPGK